MKTYSSSEYGNLHADYKLTRPDGQTMALVMNESGATVLEPVAVLDSFDAAILEARKANLSDFTEPIVGDWLRFSDGRMERVTHIWPADWHADEIATVQTTHPKFGLGSFYLGQHGCSYSGALDDGIKVDRLTFTGELRPGGCWFFHHDHARAHNGVSVEIPFRVYEVTT